MFEVIVAGMVFDLYPTYRDALRCALALGMDASVQKSRTPSW